MTENKEFLNEDVVQAALSDSVKIVLLKRLLRLHHEPGVLLLLMVAVLEPEAARQTFLKYANEKEWLAKGWA